MTISFQPVPSKKFETLNLGNPNWKNRTYQASFRFEGGEFIGESLSTVTYYLTELSPVKDF